MLVTGNRYQATQEHRVKLLAFESSEHGLHELLEMAVAEDWPTATKRVHSSSLVRDALPRPTSQKSGGSNAWFRLAVEATAGTSCSVDVQPLFTEGVRPSNGSPLFVRKYDGLAGISPGLDAIFEADHGLELRHYQLLGNLSLEFTGLSLEEIDTQTASQYNHQSTLAIINQHRPTGSSREMPLDQALTLHAFGD